VERLESRRLAQTNFEENQCFEELQGREKSDGRRYILQCCECKKLGWNPTWFGCAENDEDCVQAIMKFQSENNLHPDGMCGPTTFRYISTQREAHFDEIPESAAYSEHIICNGQKIPIDWPKVVTWNERGGLKASDSNYRHCDSPRDITMFVNHWDVCLSSRRCQKVLNARGISVHFLIDNDGTIYQTMDMNDIAWHAGSREWNNCSIGVEITNAFELKYQDWYVRNGFGERPIWESMVHGQTVGPHLGFYDVQIQALKKLWKAVHMCTRIRWQTPLDGAGFMWPTRHAITSMGEFHGFVNHFHLKRSKIDCAGLDIPKLLKEARDE
jgi:uncharacterized protein YeaC (DUF1315 family)